MSSVYLLEKEIYTHSKTLLLNVLYVHKNTQRQKRIRVFNSNANKTFSREKILCEFPPREIEGKHIRSCAALLSELGWGMFIYPCGMSTRKLRGKLSQYEKQARTYSGKGMGFAY